jgi:hypothetical protein
MADALIYVVLYALGAVPIRVAASWFGAKRKSWLASILVLLVGAVLVNAALRALPTEWTQNTYSRFSAIFLVLALVSLFGLEIKAWQAGLLSLFLTVAYWFSLSA